MYKVTVSASIKRKDGSLTSEGSRFELEVAEPNSLSPDDYMAYLRANAEKYGLLEDGPQRAVGGAVCDADEFETFDFSQQYVNEV